VTTLAQWGCLLSLIACTPVAQTPRATVAAEQLALVGAGRLALVYMTRPACPQPTGVLCADPAIKRQIRVSFDAADDTLIAAQADAEAGRPVDLTGARVAVASLSALLATLPR